MRQLILTERHNSGDITVVATFRELAAAVDLRLRGILAILAPTTALPAFDHVSRAVLGIEAPGRIGLGSGLVVARMARTWFAGRYGGA